MRLVCSAIGVLVAIAMAATAATARAAPPLLVVPAASQTLHLAVAAPQGVQAEAGKYWQLVEVDHADVCLPVEVVAAIGPDGKPAARQSTLLVNISPNKKTSAVRNFRLEPGKCSAETKGLRFTPLNDKSLELREGGKPVLVYNHGVITNEALPVKETRRSRACFVHPLYGLHGEVLTDAFPKDHYHHLGMFWAWPHIFIEGKEYDLWMYKNIKQKFVSWLAQDAGPAAAQLAVENGWFIGDKKVATERVWLRTFPAVEGHRAIDVDLVVTVGDKAITLMGAPEKSYGGLNLRFAPRKDTVITVPSGKTKDDLPDTKLAWADLTAQFAGAPAPTGAAIFVPPTHPDYPPTWLTRHYGVLCVGWPGVKKRTFEPGEIFHLSYRVWIHDRPGELDALKAAYEAYQAGLKAEWK